MTFILYVSKSTITTFTYTDLAATHFFMVEEVNNLLLIFNDNSFPAILNNDVIMNSDVNLIIGCCSVFVV